MSGLGPPFQPMEPLLGLLLPFGLMWLLLIRPQQRRMRQHQAVVASLEVGDEVVTAGGVYGMVTSIDDEIVGVEVAPGTVLRVLRSAITQRLSPPAELGDDLDEDDDAHDGDDGHDDVGDHEQPAIAGPVPQGETDDATGHREDQ